MADEVSESFHRLAKSLTGELRCPVVPDHTRTDERGSAGDSVAPGLQKNR